jgi:UDP-N-acetylglucosamine 2-epimerase (non-hydrolysing)
VSPHASSAGREQVHVVLVGTKPDIIKQAPVYHELVARGHRALVCHTGQHFDHSLSGAMLSEFGIEDVEDLRATGSATDLVSRITDRLGRYLGELTEEVGQPILYVHGDTTTAMAGSLAGFTKGLPVVHVEAGLRTLSPSRAVLHDWLEQFHADEIDWDAYRKQLLTRSTYERGSREPSPEQFNTRTADAAANLHAAPVELNREYLLEEGFFPGTIAVVGNSVVDALERPEEATQADIANVLETYPQLASREFIRICVHRKENTDDLHRFAALMEGMEQLLETGHSILFIRLNGTESAIDRFGYRDWLEGLVERHGDRFVTSPVWDSYANVLAAMRLCSAVATDSGSIQEEVNVMGVPCVTLRFGSDRGESLLAGGNFLAPPTTGAAVANVVKGVHALSRELSWDPIYPSGASKMLVDAVEERLGTAAGLVVSEEWRYGLERS